MAPFRFLYIWLSAALVFSVALTVFDNRLYKPSATPARLSAPPAVSQEETEATAPQGRLSTVVSENEAAFRLQSIALPRMPQSTKDGEDAQARHYEQPRSARAGGFARREDADRRTNQKSRRLASRLMGFIPTPQRRPYSAPMPGPWPTQAVANADYRDGQPDAFTPQTRLATSASVITLNEAGYSALNLGNTVGALSAFKQSVALDPKQPLIHSQIGYLQQAAGRYGEARQSFSTALDQFGEGQAPQAIGRTYANLSRPLRVSAYTVWRENSRREADISFGPSLAQSQSGLQATYRLPFAGWASKHDLSTFARLLWAYEPESLSIDNLSYQAGFGLQVRPLKGENIILAAERLVALGDQARSDWLLRGSWSAGEGYGVNAGESSWLHWSTYMDAALIDPSDPDIQLTADARIGYGWRPFDRSSLAVMPFIGMAANYQDAGGTSTDLYEAAAGVWLRLWPGDRAVGDPQRAIDMRVEYRGKLAGDSGSTSGIRVTLGATY